MSARSSFKGVLGAALAVAALALPAQAQDGGNGWTAFVGCWQPLDAGDEAGLLCFRPSGDGVEMFNVVDGDVASSERFAANGAPRPVSAEGCTGTESATFSSDGLRVFTRSQFRCGDATRAGSGVMSFIAPTQWVDVRSLDVEGEPVAWVQRYTLADADAIEEQGIDDPAAFDRTLVRAMRVRAAQDIEVDDVEEAVSRVEPRAVEVWLATNETRLELSGSELVRLADAGVPESVIDVMVAVSYPQRFALTPDGGAEVDDDRRGDYDADYRRGYRSYLWGPYYRYRPVGGYYGYSPFGYYGYGYGYGLGGYYGGYYGYQPVRVIVQPNTDGPSGRMVPGRGYTRGSSQSTGSSAAGARTSSPPRASRPASSSGGGGAASSGGSSSSGSSGSSSGRRTASPRN